MKKFFTVLFILFGFVLSVSAQNITVSGVVLDPNGDPIVNASVVSQTTNARVSTDIDGLYTISVPSNDMLEVSCIGFDSQVKSVSGKHYINFVLFPSYGTDSEENVLMKKDDSQE